MDLQNPLQSLARCRSRWVFSCLTLWQIAQTVLYIPPGSPDPNVTSCELYFCIWILTGSSWSPLEAFGCSCFSIGKDILFEKCGTQGMQFQGEWIYNLLLPLYNRILINRILGSWFMGIDQKDKWTQFLGDALFSAHLEQIYLLEFTCLPAKRNEIWQ